MVISLFILCFASTLAFSSTNKEKQLEALSDSISNKIGQKDFMPFYQEYMSLARQQNDTVNIDNAYSQIASHYYRLRNTDSLKVVAYEYMDWCLKCGHVNNRYTQWRQYIQLLTEKGLQDEAMRETELLQKDAEEYACPTGTYHALLSVSGDCHAGIEREKSSGTVYCPSG